MMKRRKIVCPRRYLHKARLGKKLTRQRVGHIHARLRGTGRVCSSPVQAPPELERVWVRKSDPCAPIMDSAANRSIVSMEAVESAPGLPGDRRDRFHQLSRLGVAVVPVGDGQARLIGTSPHLAGIANQVHHGRRRRPLGRRELIESVYGLRPNGRRTSVTDQRLEHALSYFCSEFGSDLSDLINHESVLI